MGRPATAPHGPTDGAAHSWADQLGLDTHDVESGLGQRAGDGLAAYPETDDDHVGVLGPAGHRRAPLFGVADPANGHPAPERDPALDLAGERERMPVLPGGVLAADPSTVTV